MWPKEQSEAKLEAAAVRRMLTAIFLGSKEIIMVDGEKSEKLVDAPEVPLGMIVFETSLGIEEQSWIAVDWQQIESMGWHRFKGELICHIRTRSGDSHRLAESPASVAAKLCAAPSSLDRTMPGLVEEPS